LAGLLFCCYMTGNRNAASNIQFGYLAGMPANILLWFFFALQFEHAIYVSVTEVTKIGDQTWTISCRMFNNDLEDAIRNHTGKSVSLRSHTEVENASELISGYIVEKLKFLDEVGRVMTLKWESGSAENDSVWCNFTLSDGNVAEIENILLLELFASQENVVTVIREEERQYLRFNFSVRKSTLGR